MNENYKEIQYEHSTVFNTDANIIVNTVNCKGFMNAGIALEFRLRYPEMYYDYKNRCDNEQVKVGNPYIFRYNDINNTFKYKNVNILNFPTKDHWRYPSQKIWIKDGLKNLVKEIKKINEDCNNKKIESIAFPKLGCGKGGLDWEKDVRLIMEEYLTELCKSGIKVYICLDDEQEAKGIEKSMLEIVRGLSVEELRYKVKLNQKQSEIVKESSNNINRFWQFSNILTLKGYEKLFNYCYGAYFNKDDNGEQERWDI